MNATMPRDPDSSTHRVNAAMRVLHFVGSIPDRIRRRMRRITHDRRIMIMALVAGLPGSVTTLILIWGGTTRPRSSGP